MMGVDCEIDYRNLSHVSVETSPCSQGGFYTIEQMQWHAYTAEHSSVLVLLACEQPTPASMITADLCYWAARTVRSNLVRHSPSRYRGCRCGA